MLTTVNSWEATCWNPMGLLVQSVREGPTNKEVKAVVAYDLGQWMHPPIGIACGSNWTTTFQLRLYWWVCHHQWHSLVHNQITRNFLVAQSLLYILLCVVPCGNWLLCAICHKHAKMPHDEQIVCFELHQSSLQRHSKDTVKQVVKQKWLGYAEKSWVAH